MNIYIKMYYIRLHRCTWTQPMFKNQVSSPGDNSMLISTIVLILLIVRNASTLTRVQYEQLVLGEHQNQYRFICLCSLIWHVWEVVKRPLHIAEWPSTTGQIFWRFICHNRIVGKRCWAAWIYAPDLSAPLMLLLLSNSHTWDLQWTNVIRGKRKHMPATLWI